MATALVRMIEDKQIVGMFVYQDSQDLFWLVDQSTNPYACEFINLKYGGLIWKQNAGPLISDKLKEAWNADDDGELLNEVGDETYDNASLDKYAFEQAVDSKWIQITKKFSGL